MIGSLRDVGMWLWRCLPLGKLDLGPSCQVREAALHWGAIQGPIFRSDQVLLQSVGSPSPTFLKEVNCPPYSIPPGETLPGLSWVPVHVGEAGGGCATHLRSQLPLDAEKSNFLPNCHCPCSLPSQPTSAWRRHVPPIPRAPDSCLPLPTPRRTPAPLLGHPCRDAPYIMSAAGRG